MEDYCRSEHQHICSAVARSGGKLTEKEAASQLAVVLSLSS